MIHTPVLKKEVLEALNPGQNENFIDCTIGEGGHSDAILNSNGPKGKVLGIDWDPQQFSSSQWLEANFKDRIILANDSYANLQEIVEKNDFNPINGILLDLGMSSVQLEASERGFTFKVDQDLDMRYNDQANDLTAEIIVNGWPEARIEKVIEEYGEERFAKKIARAIVEERKKGRIKTTFGLIEVIAGAIPQRMHHGKIHFATRTFQALRIAANDELENLKRVLPQAISVLSSGGRLAVISFHSLEDRIVKQFLAEKSKEGLIKILTKKPITADSREIRENPRSRSAKLRAAIKI